jgi:hypothetical protein
MSSNKKFRIQNGVDITGDVVVGDQLVIQSDGTIIIPSIQGMISQIVASELASLQSQVDDILGSSPDQLNTLQEIVALFQSADGDLATLINQNSIAIAALQVAIDSKASSSDVTTLSASTAEAQTLISGGSSATLATTSTNVVDALNELHSGITSLSGGLCINYDASTGVISIDEADAAANLHVATSGESTNLGGQSASHYRQDVYNIQGNIIN